ncbi:MAG: FAD:protein FMN transferase, partial [Verrucomicrobia bacterium]|nr:FAD:protein FMN transferase [Verrucomicrobiota bacterium]
MSLVAQQHRAPPPAPSGAAAALPLRKISYPSLGTKCEVKNAAPGCDYQAVTIERAAVAWVVAFEAKYSRFR